MKKWLLEMFSMSERKTSVIIVCLVASITFAFTMYVLNGDITNNLKDVILALVFTVGGVNGLNIAKNFFSGVTASSETTNNNTDTTSQV